MPQESPGLRSLVSPLPAQTHGGLCTSTVSHVASSERSHAGAAQHVALSDGLLCLATCV